MPTPHAIFSKMLAERTASRNVLVLFYFIPSEIFISMTAAQQGSKGMHVGTKTD